MRIGLDIDGVIYKWDKTARYMLREVLPGSPYNVPWLKEWDQDPTWDLHQESTRWDCIKENIHPEHWKWLWTEGVRLGLFRYGHLYPGSIQAVRELATIGEVVLITHRPKQAVEDTLAWLSYQNLPIMGVHLLTNEENKGLVRPGVDVFLDDKPQNILDMRAGNPKTFTYLMRRPWNEGVAVPGDEVRSWSEFIAKVRSL